MTSAMNQFGTNRNLNYALVIVCLVLIVWSGYLHVRVSELEKSSVTKRMLVDQIAWELRARLIPAN